VGGLLEDELDNFVGVDPVAEGADGKVARVLDVRLVVLAWILCL